MRTFPPPRDRVPAAAEPGAVPCQRSAAISLRKRNAVPFLDAETEATLVSRWQDANDPAALDHLVASFQGLVIKIAKQHLRYGLPLADLIAEGNVGLIRAIAKFDRSRGFRLSTYAMWWIRAAVGEYAMQGCSILKGITTENHKRLFYHLHRLRAKSPGGGEGDLPPETITAIADQLRVSEAEVISVHGWLTSKTVSIHAPMRIGERESNEWQDLLADTGEDPETRFIRAEETDKRKALLGDALRTLDARERRILTERLLSDEPRKLAELGAEYGVSRERIRQIEARAMVKLRKRVRATAAAKGVGIDGDPAPRR
jgi:RNA polymerase sigma-32 factor